MDDLERLYKTHYAAVVRFLYRKIWDADSFARWPTGRRSPGRGFLQ
jgi:hypothetical protein